MVLSLIPEKHRFVATEILIHRSRGDWSLDDDRAAVVAERLLWSQMSDDEQAAENAWLVSVWVSRGATRTLNDGAGVPVKISDSAFGLAVDGYRPWARGPWVTDGFHDPLWKWLWLRGYQVIRFDPDQDIVTMVIPPHRLVQESERLVSSLVKANIVSSTQVGPWGGGKPIQIRSSYDPIQGVATLDLVGVIGVVG